MPCTYNRVRTEAPMQILVVEDEPKVLASLKEGLESHGHHVECAATGEDGFFLVSTQVFDVVVLDIMLPGRNGLEVLRALRARALQTPVLILTARDAIEDRVAGLDAGADDYLVKPFALAELLARIRALLRRGRADQVLRLSGGGVDMDLVTGSAWRDGQRLDLTRREFEVLEVLLRNWGHVVPRETLAKSVWHDAQRTSAIDNLIDVHIARLRKKIDRDFEPKLIHTARGRGFVLDEAAP